MNIYHAYVYCVTNTITEEFYYGFRSANQQAQITPENDLFKKYFTSSKIVKQQIKTLGIDNFKIEILITNIDPEFCFWEEQELIKQNIDNCLCINKQYLDKNTGSRMFSTAGQKRAPFSEEWRQKMSDSHKGAKNINYGKSLSPESLKKLSNSKKGKLQTDAHKRKNSDANKGENNHMYGKTHTPEAINKMKESAANRPNVICPVCGKSGKLSGMIRWHFSNCKN